MIAALETRQYICNREKITFDIIRQVEDVLGSPANSDWQKLKDIKIFCFYSGSCYVIKLKEVDPFVNNYPTKVGSFVRTMLFARAGLRSFYPVDFRHRFTFVLSAMRTSFLLTQKSNCKP